MANNYAHFSEVIEDLSPYICEWIETVLDTNISIEKLKELGIKGAPELDTWPGFDWEIEPGIDASSNNLWIHCEESYTTENLVVFIQALLKQFKPDYIFKMCIADFCDKPRISEFGGGWYVISKDRVLSGNTWDAANEAENMIQKSNKNPACKYCLTQYGSGPEILKIPKEKQ